jgi:hypothetical protein
MTRTRWVPRAAVGLAALLAALAAGFGTAAAHAPVIGVVPSAVAGSLAPGASMNVNKTVHTTEIPPLVDILLLEDETASFVDDIANLQALAAPGGPLITELDDTGADYATGVAGFRDFAQSTWGAPGDWVYRRLADIAPGAAGLLAGVPLLTASGGADIPEAQLEALHYAADVLHAAIDSNGDGDTTDANDTPQGQQPSWRPGAKRVILLATDADCHVTGDEGGWPGDAATTSAAAIATFLSGEDITVIGLTPGGAGTIACVDTLAAGTGGTVHATTATGEDIVEAIMEGLGNLPVTVTPSEVCDPGLSIAFAPASQMVTSGDDAVFVETITADAAAPQGMTLMCTVNFLIDGMSAGPGFRQTIEIDILDVTPPAAGCFETTNPSGKNVPQAGPSAGKSGQNPDGFYLLRAGDNVDVASIVIMDSGSSFVSDPFMSGDKVKITQTPGGTPSDTRPGPGGITSHLKLVGDAILVVTDTSGNVTQVRCLVPPPPK